MKRRFDLFGGNAQAFMSKAPEILLAGGAGSGKTAALLCKALTVASRYPGSRTLFCRKTRESMTESVLVTWENAILGSDHPILTRRPTLRRVRQSYDMGNGSVVAVGGLDKPDKILSSEWDLIIAFEATDLELIDWETLGGRLRNGRVPWQQLAGDCNPTSPVAWPYRRFQSGTLKLFTSKHSENPRFCDQKTGEWTEDGKKYLARLQLMTGARRKRFLEGVWAASEGLVYDNFDPTIHVHPAGWSAPQDWPIVFGLDFGFYNPLALTVWAIDPDARIHLVREVYRTQTRVETVARLARSWVDTGEIPEPVAVVCDHDPENAATWNEYSKLPATMADKSDKGEGIEAMQRRFDLAHDGRPRIYLAADTLAHPPQQELIDAGKPTCLRDELGMYCWDTRNPNRLKDEPIKANDHACFVAGTMVTTDRGNVSIEDIRPGDQVLTRTGFAQVIDAGVTCESAQVLSVVFENGCVLTGTSDHPVWIDGLGFRRMDELRYGDNSLSLVGVKGWKSSTWGTTGGCIGCDSRVSSIVAIRNPSGTPTGRTSGPVLDVCEKGVPLFTATCGPKFTDAYRKGTRSITRTATTSTTPSEICNCSPLPNTKRSTANNSPSGCGIRCELARPSRWLGCEKGRPSGTDPKKVERGTVSTPARSWPNCHSLARSANTAARTIESNPTPRSGPCTVPTSARQPHEGCPGWMTSGEPASAGGCSSSTGTPRHDTAPRHASALSPASRARSAESFSSLHRRSKGGFALSRVLTRLVHAGVHRVFNLTVAGQPEYFANGILVHNCDSARYVVRYVDTHLLDRGSDGGYGTPTPSTSSSGW